ncbi:unnamed protein product [Arabis nemorensis]|uniref:Uncharacterized protein n=1 Tax=Arabis nemorensis TaxID=586526 RepID=A0A565CFS9_9BRAS|nr:unnamed protein product [Arabis nemorensis]
MDVSSVNCSSKYDRSKRVSSIESQKYDELNEKYNQLLKQNYKRVQLCENGADLVFCQEFAGERTNELQEMSYVRAHTGVQNQGFLQKEFVQNAGFTGSPVFSR